jgi:UDP-2,3-diacylglucosamine pyrophosphatase LpxH
VTAPPTSPPGPPRDLVVVSDLHLGRGRSPASKRWYRLETFFYDDDFRAFCRWLCRERAGRDAPPLALVLNGDTFDLLRIEPEPAPGARGPERRFGPPPSPEGAARMVADILAGHPAFVEGLAEVLANGHEVILLPGNHDLELQHDEVQAAVRAAVAEALEARGAPAPSQLAFAPWFLHEPGRVWIEHGCQYDPENAFRFPLRRALDREGAEAVARHDLPLGNFFQKYLYNAFGHITFIVPSSRANYRYLRWLLANRPRLLARVLWSHAPFLVQFLRRLARAADPSWQRPAEAAHAAEVARLAAESGLGERLAEVDALKRAGADAARAAAGILRQLVTLTGGVALATVLGLAVFASASAAIGALQFGAGWKALLSLVLYLAFGAVGAAGLVAAALRMPTDEPPRPLLGAAERIAGLVDVPLVVFGHTHDEVIAPLARPGGPAWYFNTGTWIAVFTHDVLVPRQRVQFTFLQVRGAEAELLQWSPQRDRPLPVILLEDDGRPDLEPAAGEAPAGVRPG